MSFSNSKFGYQETLSCDVRIPPALAEPLASPSTYQPADVRINADQRILSKYGSIYSTQRSAVERVVSILLHIAHKQGGQLSRDHVVGRLARSARAIGTCVSARA